MNLRCQRGDLAIIERNTTTHGCYDALIGTPIVCAELGFDIKGPVWRAVQPLQCVHCGGPVRWFLGFDLRPIRPAPAEAVRDILEEASA